MRPNTSKINSVVDPVPSVTFGGSLTQVALRLAKDAIPKVAPTVEERAATMDQLCEAAGVKLTTGKSAVAELEAEGSLKRVGKGKKNDAFRYWAPALIESEPPVVPTEPII